MNEEMAKKEVKEVPKTSENVKKPRKKKVVELYVLWRSIPFIFKEITLSKIGSLGFNISDGSEFSKLVGCKTKEEFAKTFDISSRQLRVWDKSDIIKEKIDKMNKESNVMRFKKDIDFHFTQRTIKEADAARVKLWKQLYEGWQEKQETKIGSEALEDIAKTLKKIVENP